MRARILLLLLLQGLAAAQTGTLTQLESNGGSSNRLDIVIMGDGYQAGELSKFATDAQNVANNFFSQEPWKSYHKLFNVWRLDLASVDSGVSHPEKSITKNTAFGAYYNCNGIQRLICLDSNKVNTALAAIPANQRDLAVVLVNDTQYGGSGGFPAVASLDPSVIELVLHETGHSFGLLTDEYGGPPPPACDLSREPSAANATMVTDRTRIKWAAWIDAQTPLPTTTTTPGLPGEYLGAAYCDAFMYRPTYNSKMRSLGFPYEQINAEQLVRRYYSTVVHPIDAASPTAGIVTLAQGASQTFSVTIPAIDTLKVSWTLDNIAAANNGTAYTLNTAGLAAGTHFVTATVADQTTMVRSDPSGLLTQKQTWSVTVTSTGGTIPTPVFTSAGVTNSASFVPGVTPGSIVTIFGTGLTLGVTGIVYPATVLPTTLMGTSVKIGGVAAPIFGMASVNGLEQINVQVPYEMTGRSTADIVVTNNGVNSAAVTVMILAAQPGIFEGAVLHLTTNLPVTAANPASKGEFLVIYATGLGPVSPAPATGSLASASPLSFTTIAPVVTIGTSTALVPFSGLAPSFAGLYQLNVQVAQDAPTGAASLVINVAGAASKAVTINLK